MEVRDLSAAELLDVWDRGAGTSPIERAAALLGRVHGADVEDVLRWPLGERDARLLAFRSRSFGTTLELLSECPRCGETAEAELDVAALLAAGEAVPEVHEVRIGEDGPTVTFRAINSEDVLVALHSGGERALIERCVIDLDEVVDTAVDSRLADAFAAADPLAEVSLAMECPACGEHWAATLDPPSFVWREIDAWAGRMLREVDALARAYGWSERDILALGPARRAAYLEMVS